MSSYQDWMDYFAGRHNVPYSPNETWGQYLKGAAYNAIPATLKGVRSTALTASELAAASDPTLTLATSLKDTQSGSNRGERAVSNMQRNALRRVQAIPAGVSHVIAHPVQSFHDDPVGVAMLARGATGLARSGLGAMAEGADTAASGLYPGSTGAVALRGTAMGARGAQRAVGTIDSALSAPQAAVRALRKVKPASVFSPTANNPASLSPEADRAISSSGLSDVEQARVRSNPTLLREWEKTSQYGKDGRPIGVSPASLRQAILQHSGVSPENVSYSAAAGEAPKNAQTALEMNTAARGELPSRNEAAPESGGGVKFGSGENTYLARDGRVYSPSGVAFSDPVGASIAKAYGIDLSGAQAARPNLSDVSDIAHNILDQSDAAASGQLKEGAWVGPAGKIGKGLVDLGATGISGYIGSKIDPYFGAAIGPAVGYMTDRALQGPVSKLSAGNPAVEAFGAPPAPINHGYLTPLVAGVASARQPEHNDQVGGAQYTDIAGPPPEYSGEGAGAPSSPNSSGYSDIVAPPPQPENQGGRVAYKKGGKVIPHIEPLVQDLMYRYKHAKKAETATTKPLLQHHDKAIVKALNIAKKAI